MSQTILSRALSRDTFRDLHIVDMHNHLGPQYNYYLPKAEIEEMVYDADLLGIERLVVAPHLTLSCDYKLGNRQTYDAAVKFPDRVWGMLVLNPHKPDEIDAQFDQYYGLDSFIGVKIHPTMHDYTLSGPSYLAVFDRIARLGGYVLTHTWESGSRCDARACETVLRQFPGVSFILAHALGLREGIYKAIELVNRYDNCYIDTSGFEFSDVAIEEIVSKVDPSKVFFGSDMPYHDLRGGVSRILFADLRDELKEKLLSGHFRAFLQRNRKK